MTNKISKKQLAKKSRQIKIRSRIFGTKNQPRLNVFRSLKHINVQIIDDTSSTTLISASDKELKIKKGTKTELAKEVGKLIAKKALEKNIKKVVFDRAGYKYHGRVKAVAEGAREAGLDF